MRAAFILFCFFTLTSVKAQFQISPHLINPSDSFEITSGCVLKDGHIITGSLSEKIYVPGGSGTPGATPAGKMVLRKLDNRRIEQWKIDFGNAPGRILQIKEWGGQQKILVCGTFKDSIQFAPNQWLKNNTSYFRPFIACYDFQGNYLWSFSAKSNSLSNHYFQTFGVKNNEIFIPHYYNFTGDLFIQVLDEKGDSINNFLLADQLILINNFEFDDKGNLFFSGTGNATAKVSNHRLGLDTTVFGYATTLVKLDTAFQHQWSRTWKYVTFDHYPKMALNNGMVGLIVDTFPIPNGIGNFHFLKVFSDQGQLLFSDSIGEGFFSRMHRGMTLGTINNQFFYATISGFDTITFNILDSNFSSHRLGKLKMPFTQSYPFLAGNDSVLYYVNNFKESLIYIGNDTIYNPKYDPLNQNATQQYVVKISLGNPNMQVSESKIETTHHLTLYPNPNKGIALQIKSPERDFNPHKMEVYTLQGQKCWEHEIIGYNAQKIIPLPKLEEGIYLLVFRSRDNVYSGRLIVKK